MMFDWLKEKLGIGEGGGSSGSSSGGRGGGRPQTSTFICPHCGMPHTFGSRTCARDGKPIRYKPNDAGELVPDLDLPRQLTIADWAVRAAIGLGVTAGLVATSHIWVPVLVGSKAATAVVVVAAAGAAGAGSAEAGTTPPAPPLGPVNRPTTPKPPRIEPEKHVTPTGPYYIYAVNTSGWSLYIGRTAEVEGRRASSFTDGGNGTNLVEFKKVAGGQAFDSPAKAMEYLKANVTLGKHSVWTGQWVKLGGEEFRTVHTGGLK